MIDPERPHLVDERLVGGADLGQLHAASACASVSSTSLINCSPTRSGPILSILSTCRSTAAGSAMSKPR